MIGTKIVTFVNNRSEARGKHPVFKRLKSHKLEGTRPDIVH